MAALSYGASRCCNYEMAVWRSCMERRWNSSEPSGRSRGKVVRKIRKLFSLGGEGFRQVGSEGREEQTSEEDSREEEDER